jgi:hypothetical protein
VKLASPARGLTGLALVVALSLVAVAPANAGFNPARILGESVSFRPDVDVAPSGAAVAGWQRGGGPSGVVEASHRRDRSHWYGPSEVVSASGGIGAESVRTAIAADGSAIVVWERKDGDTDVIEAAIRGASETEFRPAVRLSEAGQDSWDAEVGAGGTDNAFVVTWLKATPGSDGTVQQKTLSAQAAGPAPENLTIGSGGSAPAIDVGRGGATTVAWIEGNMIRARTRASSGGSFSAVATLTDGSTSEFARRPDVAVDAQGDSAVVWERGTQVRTSYRPAGEAFSASQTVDNPAAVPQVDLDGAGRATIVYERFPPDQRTSATVVRREPDGSFAGKTSFGGGTEDDSIKPQVDVVDAGPRQGDAVIAWWRSAGTDPAETVDDTIRVTTRRGPTGFIGVGENLPSNGGSFPQVAIADAGGGTSAQNAFAVSTVIWQEVVDSSSSEVKASDDGPPASMQPPAITGEARVSQDLVADTGAWNTDADSFGFTWQRCNTGGSTCSSWETLPNTDGCAEENCFRLTEAEEGRLMRVKLQATNENGTSAPVDSNPVGPVAPETDTTPPDTTITQAPPANTTDPATQFRYASSEPSSSFRCTLDGVVLNAGDCNQNNDQSGATTTGSYTTPALAPGEHTFTVIAIDGSENEDLTPAEHTWTIGESGQMPQNNTPPSLTGSPSLGATLTTDRGTWSNNPTRYFFQWQRCFTEGPDCTDFRNITGDDDAVGEDQQSYVPKAADLNRRLRVAVQALKDGVPGSNYAFSPGSAPIRPQDTEAPVIALEDVPKPEIVVNPRQAIFGCAGGAPGDLETVTLRIYSGSAASGTALQSPQGARSAREDCPSGFGWSIQPAEPLADGVYTVQAEQSDDTGKVGRSETWTFTLDSTAPRVTVDPPGGSQRIVSGRQLRVSGCVEFEEDATTVVVYIYKGRGTAGEEARTPITTVARRSDNRPCELGGAWTTNAFDLPKGVYTVEAQARDDQLNTTASDPVTFTVDPPKLTLATLGISFISDAPGGRLFTNAQQMSPGGCLGGVGDRTHRVRFRFTGPGISPGSYLSPTPKPDNACPSGLAWSTSYPLRGEGVWAGFVEQLDAADRVLERTPTRTFTVDQTGPRAKQTSPEPGSTTKVADRAGFRGPVHGTLETGPIDEPKVRLEFFTWNGRAWVKGEEGSCKDTKPVCSRSDVTVAGNRWTLDNVRLPPGTHGIQVIQLDRLGNVGRTVDKYFTFVYEPPPPATCLQSAQRGLFSTIDATNTQAIKQYGGFPFTYYAPSVTGRGASVSARRVGKLKVRIALKVGRKSKGTIAKGKARPRKAGYVTLRVKLNRKGKRLFKSRRNNTLLVTSTYKPRGGKAVVVAAKMTRRGVKVKRARASASAAGPCEGQPPPPGPGPNPGGGSGGSQRVTQGGPIPKDGQPAEQRPLPPNVAAERREGSFEQYNDACEPKECISTQEFCRINPEICRELPSFSCQTYPTQCLVWNHYYCSRNWNLCNGMAITINGRKFTPNLYWNYCDEPQLGVATMVTRCAQWVYCYFHPVGIYKGQLCSDYRRRGEGGANPARILWSFPPGYGPGGTFKDPEAPDSPAQQKNAPPPGKPLLPRPGGDGTIPMTRPKNSAPGAILGADDSGGGGGGGGGLCAEGHWPPRWQCVH